MSTILIFDRAAKLLTLMKRTPIGLTMFGQYFAANNTASNSRGPWPEGVFKAEKLVKLPPGGDDPNGPYGPWFLRFIVPDRDGINDAIDIGSDDLPDKNDGPGIGMGIHSGRRDGKDTQGRSGYLRATMGCIRTNDEAMVAISGAAFPITLVVIS